MEEIFPGLVYTDNKGYKSINYWFNTGISGCVKGAAGGVEELKRLIKK